MSSSTTQQHQQKLDGEFREMVGAGSPTTSLSVSDSHPMQSGRGLSFYEPHRELEDSHGRSVFVRSGRSRSTTWSTLASLDSTAHSETETDGDGMWMMSESEPSSWGMSMIDHGSPSSERPSSKWKGKGPARVGSNGATGATATSIMTSSPSGLSDHSQSSEDGALAGLSKGKERALETFLSPNPEDAPKGSATSRSPSIAFVDSFPPSWTGPSAGQINPEAASLHRRSFLMRSRSPSGSLSAQRASFRSSPVPSRPPTPGIRTEASVSASLFQDAVESAAIAAARGRPTEPSSRARAFSMGHLSLPGAPEGSLHRDPSTSARGSRPPVTYRMHSSLPTSAAASRPSSNRSSFLGNGTGSGLRKGFFRRRASDMTLNRLRRTRSPSRASSQASSSRVDSVLQTPDAEDRREDGANSDSKRWKKIGGKFKRAISRGSSFSSLLAAASTSREGDARAPTRPILHNAATTAFEGDGFPFPRVQRPSSPLATVVPVRADFATALTSSGADSGLEPPMSPLGGIPASIVFKGMASDDLANSRVATRPVRSMSAPLLYNQQQQAMSLGGVLHDVGDIQVDLFDLMLPRELRLGVFGALIDICADATPKSSSSRRSASNEDARWSGRSEGVRELIKCSRVCKTWLGLATDGQLWRRVGEGIMGPGGMGVDGLCRLMRGAGPFVKEMKLKGLGGGLTSMAMLRITDEAVALEQSGKLVTGLTQLDLTGCRNISTQSLHYLLSRSCHLTDLALKGLPAVTDSTCDLIRSLGAPIISLDLRQCPHMSAMGLLRACEPIAPTLKMLKVGKVRFFDDAAFTDLGKIVPGLEILDISYSSGLTDHGFRGFVARPSIATSSLTSLPKDDKRQISLTHLNISSCKHISDQALEALAHAVPRLQSLEAANIGIDMKDAGLVALFATTPGIQKVDLEDASEITDRVLYALTPSAPRSRFCSRQPRAEQDEETRQAGQQLEHLVLSYAVNVSDTALVGLIRTCHKLRVLEVDNTRVSDGVVKQFVKVCRQRGIKGAEIGAVDARGVGRGAVSEMEAQTRPRRGRRGYWAKQLDYSSSRAVAEMDDSKVVIHTFWSWSRLDEHQRQRAAARALTMNSDNPALLEEGVVGLWGVLGLGEAGRRPTPRRQSSGSASCTIM